MHMSSMGGGGRGREKGNSKLTGVFVALSEVKIDGLVSLRGF